MSEYKNILVDKRDGYAVVTLNRPEKMNALNASTIDELAVAFDALEEDPEVLGVIITGSDRAFCAGADLSSGKEKGGNPFFDTRDFVTSAQALMNRIEDFAHPVIAAVNGFALGGGCELSLACDLRIASEEAKFGLTEVKIGVMPCFGGTQRLPRLIGMAHAKDMIFTGRKVSAEEALSMGLINSVVPKDKLMSAAIEKMESIIANAPLALRMAKSAINSGSQMTLPQAFLLEADMTALLATTEDAKEGGMAMFEKRKPEFKNR